MATKCEGCGKFAKVYEVWGPGGPAISGNRMLCEPCKDPRPWPECGAEGCRRPARRRSENPWCNMHYARVRKHGSPEYRPAASRGHVNDKGYRVLLRPGHPLARAEGKVYEHRLVLYAVLGPDDQPCHWCNRMVSWDSTLEVDHLDGNKMNNTPENLAACCHACNSWNTKLRNTEGMAQ